MSAAADAAGAVPSASPAAGSAASQDDADPLQPVATNATRLDARPLRVAVLHNSKQYANPNGAHRPKDAQAELDTPRNVEAYVAAIRQLGHSVMAFEGDLELPARLVENQVDI